MSATVIFWLVVMVVVAITMLSVVFVMQCYELYRWRYVFSPMLTEAVTLMVKSAHRAEVVTVAANTMTHGIARDVKSTLTDVTAAVEKGVADTAHVAAQLAATNAVNPPSDPKIPKPVNLPG